MAAKPDGGALYSSASGELRQIGAAGSLEFVPPFGISIAAAREAGKWIDRGIGGITAIAGKFADATRWAVGVGNPQKQKQPRTPGIGLFAKAHAAASPMPFQHVSIRVTPADQQYWQNTVPNLMNCVGCEDEYGNRFFTFGAGPVGGDTGICGTDMGNLVSGRDRSADVAAAPLFLEKLAYSPWLENQFIQALLDAQFNYPNTLPYGCFPESSPGYYNSNGFASGLLNAVDLPLPSFPTLPYLFPGWKTPVPPSLFSPQ